MTNRRMPMPVDPSRVRARVRARARPRPRRPRHPRPRASACGRFERASTAARGEPARGCAVGIASAAADVASATVAFRTPPPFARRLHGRRRERRARGAVSGASRWRRRRRTHARVARRARRGWLSIARLAHAHSRRGCTSTRESACVERAREGSRRHTFARLSSVEGDANAEGARREGGD